MKTAIIGGGAAGFFTAINLKEMVAPMEVTIFERAHRVLQKVEISGGGRCNCTNSFRLVSDLSQVYPRGHRLLKRLFKSFGPEDAYHWFEERGVALVTQDDECVFPQSQDSHSIINLFLSEARRLGIEIKTGCAISTNIQKDSQDTDSLDALFRDYDFVVVTTGGSPKKEGLQWLGHEIVQPVPSLFTFQIEDKSLHNLMGTVVENATAFMPGTKLRASGPLLITHWGMSGPAILRLSSYAARLLAENSYKMPLSINWTNETEASINEELTAIATKHPQKQVASQSVFALPSRLWTYLVEKSLAPGAEQSKSSQNKENYMTRRWCDLSKKDFNRLVNRLVNDEYTIAGRAPFKDEFVTCGGISLSAVNPSTLESRQRSHLYFAGEVLDIDGVTGGFNFQAAWSTAYAVAHAISQEALSNK